MGVGATAVTVTLRQRDIQECLKDDIEYFEPTYVVYNWHDFLLTYTILCCSDAVGAALLSVLCPWVLER